MDTPTPPRADNGHFAPGNPGGPGRPKGRGYELQQAAQDAVTPEYVGIMMRKALKMGLEGNLAAMKFVMERTCGRPPEAPSQRLPLDVVLPKLRTVADCAAAIDRLLEAACQGTISLESAKVMVDLITARMRAIEMNDLEVRLAELEKTAGTVDFGGSHRRN